MWVSFSKSDDLSHLKFTANFNPLSAQISKQKSKYQWGKIIQDSNVSHKSQLCFTFLPEIPLQK